MNASAKNIAEPTKRVRILCTAGYILAGAHLTGVCLGGRLTGVIVEIRGSNPPGRRCNPSPEHGPYEDVNVGLGRYTDPVGLVPGDTADAVWRIAVRVAKRNGAHDYYGPQVEGKRGKRYIYINWLNREIGGQLRLFRRGKIMLDGLDPKLVDRAESTGAALTCTVNLTNDRGHPTTGFFRPQELDWRLAN